MGLIKLERILVSLGIASISLVGIVGCDGNSANHKTHNETKIYERVLDVNKPDKPKERIYVNKDDKIIKRELMQQDGTYKQVVKKKDGGYYFLEPGNPGNIYSPPPGFLPGLSP